MKTRTAPWDYDKRTRRTQADDILLAYTMAKLHYDDFCKAQFVGDPLIESIDYDEMDRLTREYNEAEKAYQAYFYAGNDMAQDEAERDYRETMRDTASWARGG